MADSKFLLRGRFRQCQPERFIEEVRIVAEAVPPARLVDDPPGHLATERPERLTIPRKSDRANVARRSIAHAPKLRDEQAIVFQIARALAGKSRRPHTRGAGERAHLQP